jgi:hypothetical protein
MSSNLLGLPAENSVLRVTNIKENTEKVIIILGHAELVSASHIVTKKL